MSRILIVEDQPYELMLIRDVLQETYEVEGFPSGEDALAALGINPPKPHAPLPDLIVLDVMMPGMDGYTLANILKADPRCAAVPILVVTAKGQMKEMFRGIDSIKGYVEKPFDPDFIRAEVDRILGKSPSVPASH